MHTITRLFVAALVVLATVALPSHAAAATAGWQRVNVTLQGESQPVLLVAGELPDTAALPHTGELAVPAGAQVQWVGEILGGASDQDPAMEYTKTTVGGSDIYRFTLTKSRIAQVEATVETPGRFDGKTYTSDLKWTAWQALPEVRINKQVPAGTQIVQAAPGASLLPADATNSYYTKAVSNVKAGDVVDLTFTYTVPAAGDSTAADSVASSGSNDVAVYVIFGVLIIAIALFAFQLRKRFAPPAATETVPARKQDKASKPGKVQEAQASEEPEPATDDGAPRRSRKVSPAVATAVVVGVLVAGTALAVGIGNSPRVDGGKMTRQFGSASPCVTSTVSVVAEPGIDLAEQGDKLLGAFEGKQGVTDVTLDIAKSTVEIGYCESEQSEATLRQILTGTGLVSVGPSIAKPTPAGAGEGQ
jgi:hypothetical protein